MPKTWRFWDKRAALQLRCSALRWVEGEMRPEDAILQDFLDHLHAQR